MRKIFQPGRCPSSGEKGELALPPKIKAFSGTRPFVDLPSE
jgi:hypothetical protein